MRTMQDIGFRIKITAREENEDILRSICKYFSSLAILLYRDMLIENYLS